MVLFSNLLHSPSTRLPQFRIFLAYSVPTTLLVAGVFFATQEMGSVFNIQDHRASFILKEANSNKYTGRA
jgi:hypothetical protein